MDTCVPEDPPACSKAKAESDANCREFSLTPASHPSFDSAHSLVTSSPSGSAPVAVMAQRLRIALEHPKGHANGVAATLQALEDWLRDVDGARSAAAFGGVAPAIVSAMRRYGDEAEVCKRACAAMAEAAHGDIAGVTALTDAGAVIEVCAFLTRAPENQDAQLHGVAALALLAQRTGAAKQATTASAVGLTFQAIQAYGEKDAAIASASCWALRRLAERGGAPRTGMRTAAQRMKLAHPGDVVVGHAAEALLQFVHSCDGNGAIEAPPEDVRNWPYRPQSLAFGERPYLTSADRVAIQQPCA